MSARFRLRRDDGEVYLERWGLELGRKGRFGGVFVHHMNAPDPGADLHDHPWWFFSIILKGSYDEQRALTRTPHKTECRLRKRFSIGSTARTLCHTIFAVEPGTWTLVVHGPRRGDWGFYTPEGWTYHENYDYARRGVALEAHEGAVD
jgi:hypothetical protein